MGMLAQLYQRVASVPENVSQAHVHWRWQPNVRCGDAFWNPESFGMWNSKEALGATRRIGNQIFSDRRVLTTGRDPQVLKFFGGSTSRAVLFHPPDVLKPSFFLHMNHWE